MKIWKKLHSRKQGIILSVMLLTSMILFCFLVFITVKDTDQSNELTLLAHEFFSASDSLTSDAQLYVLTQQEMYYENYHYDTSTVKLRENVLQRVAEIDIPENQMFLLKSAMQSSKDLEILENAAFEAMGAGDYQSAKDLIFSDTYVKGKKNILELTNEFEKVTRETMGSQIRQDRIQVLVSFIITMAIAMLFIVFVIKNIRILNEKIASIKFFADAAEQMAGGDFAINLFPYEKKEELSLLADGYAKIMITTEQIIFELKKVEDERIKGNFNLRVDEEQFNGEYRKIARTINAMGESFRRTLNSAPIGYIFMENGIVQSINEYAKSTMGISQGSAFKTFCENDEYEQVCEKLETMDEINGEILYFTIRNGERRRFHTNILKIDFFESRTEAIWCVDIEGLASATKET